MATHEVSTLACTPVLVPHHICQAELAHILELRRQRNALDERLTEAEAAIRAALEAGARVQGASLRPA